MKEVVLFIDNDPLGNIHQEGEMISLTDLWKASGKDRQKRPSKWQESEPVQRFLTAAGRMLNVGDSDILRTRRGVSGGTYAHKQVAIEYAQYLDPKLAVAVNQVFFERMEEEKDPDKIADRYIKTYKKQGKDNKWIAKRFEGKANRNRFTATLGEHGVGGEGFRNCTNAIYTPLFGGTTSVIRDKKNLSDKANIRDNMTSLELAAVSLAEELAAQNIEENKLFGNGKCELASSKSAKAVANAIIQSKKS